MPLAALVFDVDGTLAETEELHRQAFNATFEAHAVAARWPDPARGWSWDRDTYRRLLAVTGGKERIAAYLRDDLGIAPEPVADAIAALHRDKTARYGDLVRAGALSPRPGVAALVAAARERGLRLAVATTTSRANVDALVPCCFGMPADTLFDAIAAGDEVARKKPAPDVYALALRRLGLGAADCVALEDSAAGVGAARAAGLRCVAAPSLYLADDDLGGADLLLPDFTALTLATLEALAEG